MDNETASFELEVHATLTNDSGVYECQVNTRPKLSRPVTLTVQGEFAVEELPKSKIGGGSKSLGRKMVLPSNYMTSFAPVSHTHTHTRTRFYLSLCMSLMIFLLAHVSACPALSRRAGQIGRCGLANVSLKI